MLHKTITYLIALIWFTNGLICKVIGLVPRHQAIVAQILGAEQAYLFTKLIGVSEVLMSFWIVTSWHRKMNVIVQCVIIATMNILEFLLVPDLLLWGKWNSLFALLLIGFIVWNGRHYQQLES
jgi:hypothetical protein